MALYNNGYPMNYQYFPSIGQYQQQPQNQQIQQIQNGGLVSVLSEADARNYPVALGNSVTFKDEKLPYVYVKTMGFSQLDRPVFEKFRLVKEDAVEAQISGSEGEADKILDYALKSDLEPFYGELEAYKDSLGELESEIDELKAKIKKLEVKKK